MRRIIKQGDVGIHKRTGITMVLMLADTVSRAYPCWLFGLPNQEYSSGVEYYGPSLRQVKIKCSN